MPTIQTPGQTIVLSFNLLVPALIVLFSYLIWVQSYQYDITDLEQIIRERYENEEFPWEDNSKIKTAHVRCIELDTARYRIERIFNPFRDLEGHTFIMFYLLGDYDLEASDIENYADFDRAGVMTSEGGFQILMHAVEPEDVTGIMEELFRAILVCISVSSGDDS